MVVVLLAIFLAGPLIGWADDASSMCSGLDIFEQVLSGCSDIQLFTPSQYDLSLTFLRMIFGSVGGALYGLSNPLVGTMFRIFNTGVLLITSALITYTIFLTVVGGAQDGSGMQSHNKGMLNPWVVTRVVLGWSMLLPSFSGYSAMQVLVMYVVVQGVGFADSLWSAALNYMASTGQPIVSTPTSNGSKNLSFLSDDDQMIDRMYLSSLCVVNAAAQNPGLCRSDAAQCTVAYAQSPAYDQVTVSYPFSCGTYQLNITAITGSQDSKTNQKYAAMMQTALQQAATVLQGAAAQSMQSAGSMLSAYTGQTYSDAVPGLSSIACTKNYCAAASAYAAAASAYLEVVNYTYHLLHPPENLDKNTAWTVSAGNRGWVSAGMYYFELTQNYLTGSPSYAVTSPSDGPLLMPGGAYLLQGSPPALPSAPNNNPMVYPMQLQAAYYFSTQQTVCPAACSQEPVPDCNACQSIELIHSLSPASQGVGTGNAAAAQADQMYVNLIRRMFGLIKQIDTYSYCNLLPDGIAAGWIDLDQCTMVMPIARFNRLVLGGAVRVLMGLNLGWWSAAKSGSGSSCSGSWNGDLLNTVSGIMGQNASSSPSACLAAADRCLNSKDPLQDCGYQALYGSCMAGMYGFFPFLYTSASGGYIDPIYATSQMGMQIMSIAINYWMTVSSDVFSSIMGAAWALFGLSIPLQIAGDMGSAGLAAFAPVGGGLIYALTQVAVNVMKMFFEMSKAVLEMYLPLGASLTAIVFGLGTMMGIYMPFMPFMLYLFGVIGWVMAVIEAMVAAPLVALGITHPEGHDLLGKSEQAVMLLLGVFVRPATMILGLLFAINLAKIAVQLLDYGFLFVFTDLSNLYASSGDGMTNGFILLGALIVYAYVLMTVIDQAYSLVYQVPDKILRWIGGPQDSSSAGQMMQQVRGQVQQLGSKAGEAGSGAAGRGPEIGATTASGSRYNAPKEDKDQTAGAGGRPQESQELPSTGETS